MSHHRFSLQWMYVSDVMCSANAFIFIKKKAPNVLTDIVFSFGSVLDLKRSMTTKNSGESKFGILSSMCSTNMDKLSGIVLREHASFTLADLKQINKLPSHSSHIQSGKGGGGLKLRLQKLELDTKAKLQR